MVSSTSCRTCERLFRFLLFLNKSWNQRNNVRFEIYSFFNIRIFMVTLLFQIRYADLHRNILTIFIRIYKSKTLFQFHSDFRIHDFLTIPVIQNIVFHLPGSLFHHFSFR